MLDDENVSFVKGKVAKISEDPAASKNLILDVEDTLSGENLHAQFDLVVLATGVVPNTRRREDSRSSLKYDEYGFIDCGNGRRRRVRGRLRQASVRRVARHERCHGGGAEGDSVPRQGE